jgi:hypothetical protein
MSLAVPIEFHARFENGVLVPEEKLDLEEHQRVTLRLNPHPLPRYDDPNDPRPEGGMELHRWWQRHRIKVSEEAAKIATDPDFELFNS